MRRLLALAAVAGGLAAAGSAAACERYDPCRKPPPRIVHYEHRYVERETWRPPVQEVRLPGDFFYGGGGVEAPMGGDFYYGGGGFVIAGSNASAFAGASAFASARTSVSVSHRFRGGFHHGGKRWGGHGGGHKGGGKH